MGEASEYLDVAAVAKRLGVKPATVYQYRWKGTFPEPDDTFGGSPVWLPSTVDGWVRPGRGAGGGRPRKAPEPGP